MNNIIDALGVTEGLLPDIARQVAHEYTRNGGARGHGSFGLHAEDLAPAIVSAVYETLLREGRTDLEDIENVGGWLRTLARYAAQNVIAQEVEGYRREDAHGQRVRTQGYTVSEDEDGLVTVLDFARHADISAEAAYEQEVALALSEATVEAWDGIAHDIIDGVAHEGMREALRLYVFEGLQHKEIAERLSLSIETSKKAYARGVKDEEAIACLVVVRNLRFKGEAGTGRAPSLPKTLPTRLLDVLAG